MSEYYVYVLCDPDTCEPFYVGMGKGNRMKSSARSGTNESVARKLFAIKDMGRAPIAFKYTESLTQAQAVDIESYLIATLGRKDLDNNGILLNRHTGLNHYKWQAYNILHGKDNKPLVIRLLYENGLIRDYGTDDLIWWKK